MDEWDFGPAQEDLSGWGNNGWGETPEQQVVFDSGSNNWDGFLNNGDQGVFDFYKGAASTGPDAYGSWREDLGFTNPTTGPMSVSNLGSMPDYDSSKELTSSWDTQGIQETLAKLFADPKLISRGLGAIFEMNSNKKRAQSLDPRKAIQWLQQNTAQDPARQMREDAVQSFNQVLNDPMANPGVRAQLDQFKQQRARMDAKAGRRSNPIESEVAILGKLGELSNQHLSTMSRMYSPPNASGMASLYGGAMGPYAQYNSINPAPVFSAMSNLQQEDLVNELIKAQIERLRKGA